MGHELEMHPPLAIFTVMVGGATGGIIGLPAMFHAFLKCSNPSKLQELADSRSARDLLTCGQKWLTCFTPFSPKSNASVCRLACLERQ